MDRSTQESGDILVVTVNEDRIDAAVAIKFKDQMRDLTMQGPSRIILDLGRVEFIDSSGLGAIVASMKQLGDKRALELASLSPTVEKVFRLTRMDTVFKLHASAEEALSAHAG